jgi:hypothetical protein
MQAMQHTAKRRPKVGLCDGEIILGALRGSMQW